jgi:transposase-like protein
MAGKKESVEATVRTIRRVTRKKYSAEEEKVWIVLEGLRGETSIAALCRREGIPSNLYYRWSKDFPRPAARAGSRQASSHWWATPNARRTAGK